MEDDCRLVERYLGGEDAAFEELIVRYQRQIYALHFRMTTNAEEAKDLTQKTFVGALKGLKGFRMKSSFKTWLYRIAVNAGLNHIRDCRDEEPVDNEALCSDQDTMLASLLEKERKMHIAAGLFGLPKRQRLAVMLRVYDGLSCAEASSVMGCSVGAVKAHYHNGVAKLKDYMKEKGYDVGS